MADAVHNFKLSVKRVKRVVGCTSPCVPLLQASEKTELTMLWERAWPDVAISETPLSDWLE